MNPKPGIALLVALAVPAFTLTLAGCSSSTSTGAFGATSSDSSTGSGGGASTSSSGNGGAGGGVATCAGPDVGLPSKGCTPGEPSCNAGIAECLPVHHNAGAASFGLRMASLEFTAPPALTKGLIKGVFENGVTPNNSACNLDGGGTFSWLLAFDTAAGTLTTGGAKPAADPSQGYSFLTQDVPVLGGKLHVAPVTLTAPLDASCKTSSNAADLNLPVYFDLGATETFVLPLRQARFTGITVSGNHDCIGKYNAAGLSSALGCMATDQVPTFLSDAQVVGLINLDQADTMILAPVGESLCVVLSGDSSTYGDGGMPARCKKTGGKINFQGDWCTATNAAASAACNDAVYFAGTFAASGVIIN